MKRTNKTKEKIAKKRTRNLAAKALRNKKGGPMKDRRKELLRKARELDGDEGLPGRIQVKASVHDLPE